MVLSALGLVSGFLGKSKGATGLLLVVFLGLGGWFAFQKFWVIPELEREVDRLDAKVVRAEAEVDKCKSNIDMLNERVKAASKESEAKNKLLETLADQIGTISELNEERISVLRDAPTPETCEAAINLLRKQQRKITWKD